jgi:hypothetical protein
MKKTRKAFCGEKCRFAPSLHFFLSFRILVQTGSNIGNSTLVSFFLLPKAMLIATICAPAYRIS